MKDGLLYLDPMAIRIVLGLIFGLVLGSFTTMLSYRLPRRQSIVTPPSRCPSCGARLMPRDLIPVISWLLSRGRCRHCQAAIGARYVWIEIVTTLAVMAAFAGLGYTPALLIAVVLIVAVITAVTIALEREDA